MVRSIVSKYGRGNLGYLWLICEPMLLVGGIILIWTLIYPHGNHGLAVSSFALSSYLPLTLWRHLSSVARLLSSNFGLLYHRRITVFDIIIARSLSEVAGITTAGIVVYLMLLSLDLIEWVADPSLVLAGLLFMSGFGFGAGCLIAGLSERFEVIEYFVPPVQYFVLPLSGAFWMVSWLPSSAQSVVMAVPLVHIYEMTRAGFFGPSVETHFSIPYVAFWTAVIVTLGLWAVASARPLLSAR
ncbi:MAG TPA: sugar ABC transporter permease [Methylobacterium sp.]|nr:sugar ABC transporter permease [Methylobacterium sp.]